MGLSSECAGLDPSGGSREEGYFAPFQLLDMPALLGSRAFHFQAIRGFPSTVAWSPPPPYYRSAPFLEQFAEGRAQGRLGRGNRHVLSQAWPAEASGDAGSLCACLSHGWLCKYEPLHLANWSFLESSCRSSVSPALAVTVLIALDGDCLGPSPPLDWEPSRAGVPRVAQCSIWPSGVVR